MDWIIGDWRQLMPKPWANVALVLIAVMCGTIVGLEREREDKPAGIITLALVALGAAVFTTVSFLFDDPSRVAAQVITGIGFLGAGVILRAGGEITGIVSAATIWVMAAVGMVSGAGYAGAAVALSCFISILLWIVSRLEHRFINPCEFTTVDIVFEADGGKTIVKIEGALDANGVAERPTGLRPLSEGLVEARLRYCHTHRNHRDFLAKLVELPEIKEIRRGE